MDARTITTNFAWLLFSPTRRYIDWWKTRDDDLRGVRLRAWSFRLFVAEALGIIVFSLAFREAPTGSWTVVGIVAMVWAWSRIHEIWYAFYRDALSSENTSGITGSERLQMAMRSFLGLAFNFALLYYFVPVEKLFTRALTSFWEAFYFSGVTLATLGYGDIAPIHPISQFVALWQVGAGILLVAVSIAIYAGEK